MATKTTKTIGVLTLVLMLSGIVYVSFSNYVRIRVDYDKSTFYVYKNGTGWITSGIEYNSLLNGTKQIYRNASNIAINTLISGNNLTITRTTPYQKGSKIVDFYAFSGDISGRQDFPIYRTVDIYGAKGLIYQYEVRDLDYTGPTTEVNETSMFFGKGMKVELDPRFYWIKVYSTGILKVRYRIEDDFISLKIRLSDPTTLYIDGSTSDQSREYGQYVNITGIDTSASPGMVCINMSGFGVLNFSMNSTSFNFTASAFEWKFSDGSLVKNYTAYTSQNITLWKPLDLINGSISLYGWNTSNKYPGNVSIWSGTNLLLWLPDNLTANSYFTNHLTNGLTDQNITVGNTSNISYVTIVAPLNYTTVKFNISAHQNFTEKDEEMAGSAYCSGTHYSGCSNGYDENWGTASVTGTDTGGTYPDCCADSSTFESFYINGIADIWWSGYFSSYGTSVLNTIYIYAYNYTNSSWIQETSSTCCYIPGLGTTPQTLYFNIPTSQYADFTSNGVMSVKVRLVPSCGNPCTSFNNGLYYYEGKINYTGYPDCYVDATNDGDWDYNTTFLNSTVTVTVNSSEINSYSCGSNVTCQYPIEIVSTIGGIFNISTINFTAVTDDVYLNKTFLSNAVSAASPVIGKANITLGVNATNWGTLQLWDMNLTYFGSQNYTVMSNISGATDSSILSVYWSNFSVRKPYTWTNYILWYPDTNSSKNVTPWSQTNTIPIYNFTTLGYWNNMSIKIKSNSALNSCMNISFSNTSNFTTSIKLNTTYQTLINNQGYNTSHGIFARLDMSNCAYPFNFGNWSIIGWCKDCG